MKYLFADLDTEETLRRITEDGGTCLPGFVPDTLRKDMVAELDGRAWETADPEYGPNRVRQAYERISGFSSRSMYMRYCRALEGALNATFGRYKHPATPRFAFNDFYVQRYTPGRAYGITPHCDESRFVNLIAIAVLKGGGDGFCFYRDRDGSGRREVFAKSGDLILMKATGFCGARAEDRPLHGVEAVTRPRITFSMRQDISAAK
jgi:hypothetical protein